MHLLKLLQTKSKTFYFLLILLSLMGSLTNMGILMLINVALGGRALAWLGGHTYLAFISLVGVAFVTSYFFQNYMVELTNNVMFKLEISLIEKVRNASRDSFEKLGSERLYAAISDTQVLGRLPEIFITLINSSVTLVCSLLYLMWVSPLGCLTVLGLMGALAVVYLYRNKRIEQDVNKVRDLQDGYYLHLRELLAGFSQVRISRLRNNNLFRDYILANRTKARNLNENVSKKYIVNELSGVFSWYVVMGVVLYLLPVLYSISITQLAAFITTILFMIAPVAQLVMFFPFYTVFRVSLERIVEIDGLLQSDEAAGPDEATPVSFNTIRFENIRHHYTSRDNNAFELEIADLTLVRGENVLIVGGNGSGKTTFLHLLTGLCKPSAGKIYLDGREVSWEEFCRFSNSMAVVFTNHHLFRENYDGHDLSETNPLLVQYRQMLNLEGVLRLDSKRNYVDTNLSKGQQKRLSLLLALLERKPLLVLDEWAAEQDPLNREFFYTRWLDHFKAMGVTTIAISHDDEYYNAADRVIKFNFGKIASDSGVVSEAALNS